MSILSTCVRGGYKCDINALFVAMSPGNGDSLVLVQCNVWSESYKS